MDVNRTAAQLLAALAFSSGFLVAAPTEAAIINTADLSGPASISAGDTALFSLSLTLSSTPGAYQDTLNAIALTFHSGDGQDATQSHSYGAALGSPAVFGFSQTFSYVSAGLFTPSVDIVVNDTASFNNYVWTIVGWGSYSYSCGWWSTCYSSYPIYGYANYPYSSNLLETTTATTALDVRPVAAAHGVPEPAPVVLLAGGVLALVGTRKLRERQRPE
jgi:hypothetical protein